MNELYSICWNITSMCNEKCKFCYRKMCSDNTLEDNKKIFDNISKIKIDKITFSGGEPLLYENLFELANYIKLKKPEIKLSLTTNGQIIDEKLFNKIINTFDWISFSIDSSNNNVNEDIGRGKNHVSKVISLLDKFDGKIKLKINTVANKNNINDLENIYNIISKYNISRWKIFRFYPLRKGKENEKLFYLNDFESQLVEKYVNNKQKQNPKIKIHYNNINEFTTSYFNIYPDGSIENSKDEDIGNLLYDDILNILEIKKNDLINHDLRKNNNL